jgi:predicted dehydrogenase
MNEAKTLKIGIVGSESRSQSYARALGQVEGARVTAAAASGRVAVELQRAVPGIVVERDVGTLVKRSNIEAVVLADPVGELAGVIRRALLSDRHVLATISSPITARQIDELSSLARRRGRLLMFTEERSFHPALVFLKWMLVGRSGIWQPRYIRAVSAPGASQGGRVSIASLIVEELAICGRLMGESPHSVSGAVCRVEAEALPAAAFINLTYSGGRIASLQLSTTEAQESREWALATPSKTVLLDECDARSPVKIISFDPEAAAGSLLRVNPPVPLADWAAESTVTPPVGSTDVRVDQCRHFVQSILNHELQATNVEFWSEVALVWEAVQESVRLEGMPVDVSASLERGKRAVGERPKLRLIHGKGTGTVEARKRPALTLVPR